MITAFILLSQGLQIFTYENLLWAKVVALMYLSSYFVLLLLTFLAPKDWRTNQPLPEENPAEELSSFFNLPPRALTDGCYCVASALQIAFYFFLFDKMVHSTLETYIPGDTRTPFEKSDKHGELRNGVFLMLLAGFIDLIVAVYFWFIMTVVPLLGMLWSGVMFVQLFRQRSFRLGICLLGVEVVFTPVVAFCSWLMFHIHGNFEADEDVAEVVMEIAAVYIVMGLLYVAAVGGVIVGVRRVCEGSRTLGPYRPEGPWNVSLLVFAAFNFGMLFWFFIYGYDLAV